MAKYDVTYSCGHSGTIQLFGPYKSRDRKIEWYENEGLCPDCYAEKQRQKREEEVKAIAEKNAVNNLPELSGSEKQIAWAEKIRYTLLKDCNQWHRELIHFVKSQPYSKELFAWLEENCLVNGKPDILGIISAFMGEHAEASWWWIDHSYNEGKRRLIKGICHGEAESIFYEWLVISAKCPVPVFLQWQLKYLYRFLKYDQESAWCPEYPSFIEGKWNEKVYRNQTIYVDGKATKLDEEQYQIAKEYATQSESKLQFAGKQIRNSIR